MQTHRIEGERSQSPVPGTAEHFQMVSRSVGEAARLKAAHRYFQRTAYRPPFRREMLPLD